MECEKYNELISLYIDEQCTAAEKSRLLSHISECPACDLKLRQLTEITKALRGTPPLPLPEGFTASVMQKIENAKHEPSQAAVRTGAYMRRFGTAAAVFIAVMLAFGGLSAVLSRNTSDRQNNEAAQVFIEADVYSYPQTVPAPADSYMGGGVMYDDGASGADADSPAAADFFGIPEPEPEPVAETTQADMPEITGTDTRVAAAIPAAGEAALFAPAEEPAMFAPAPAPADQDYADTGSGLPLNNIAPVAEPTEPEIQTEEAITEAEDTTEITPTPTPAPPAPTPIPPPRRLYDTTFDSKIIHTVSIEIHTDDLFETLRSINQLPGYNSHSNVNYYNPDKTRKYGEANLVRRVNTNELEYARGILRNLGDVTNENESQADLTAEYSDLTVRANNAQNEIDRLLTLISASDTLENIVYIETRVTEIERRLDSYIGRIRQIDAQTSQVGISVYLYAYEPYVPFVYEPIEPTFAERMSRAFKRSLEFMQNLAESVTIFAAGAVVPIAVCAVFVFIVIKIYKKLKRGGQ